METVQANPAMSGTQDSGWIVKSSKRGRLEQGKQKTRHKLHFVKLAPVVLKTC